MSGRLFYLEKNMDLGYMSRDYSCEVGSNSKPKMVKRYPHFEIGSEYDESQGVVRLPISESDLNKPMTVTVTLIPTKIATKSEKDKSKRCYGFDVKSIDFNEKSASDQAEDNKSARISSMASMLKGNKK